MMNIFVFFGVIMYVLIIYLLSKIIIEKNAQSISMTKILGYRNSEINGIYIATTAIVTVVTLLVTIPLSDYLLGQLFVFFMRDYPGLASLQVFCSGICKNRSYRHRLICRYCTCPYKKDKESASCRRSQDVDELMAV